jgi:enoyl reductase-like protein
MGPLKCPYIRSSNPVGPFHPVFIGITMKSVLPTLRDVMASITSDFIRSGKNLKEFRCDYDDAIYSRRYELIDCISALNKQDFCELMNAPYDLSTEDSYNNLPDLLFNDDGSSYYQFEL